jgi:hypothetical protein
MQTQDVLRKIKILEGRETWAKWAPLGRGGYVGQVGGDVDEQRK